MVAAASGFLGGALAASPIGIRGQIIIGAGTYTADCEYPLCQESLFQAGMKSSVAYTFGNVVANFWGGLYAKADEVWMFFSGVVGIFFGI